MKIADKIERAAKITGMPLAASFGKTGIYCKNLDAKPPGFAASSNATTTDKYLKFRVFSTNTITDIVSTARAKWPTA